MADNNPRSVQRIILWATLVALAALVVLSIVGALEPGDHPEVKAAEMFNSPPLVVYWFLLAGLMLAGLVSFKRLFHSPGPLAGHVGAMLILIGAMAGSARWNAISHRFLGSQKIRSGVMAVPLGEATSEVFDKDANNEANLPFQVKLEDFWIEYYPPEKTDWELGVEAQAPAMGEEDAARSATINWAVGKEAAVPFTGAKVTVLQYFPHAAPLYDANAEPVLDIAQADGNELLLPAKAGAEVTLADANIAVRIVRVLSHLSVEGNQVLDRPDSRGLPALELRIGPPGDPNKRAFVTEDGIVMHNPDAPHLNARYVLAPILGARSAPEGPPAMEIVLSAGGTKASHWLVPKPGQPFVTFPLETELPPGHAGGHGHAVLFFAEPTGEPKAYKSQLVVLENGRQKAAQIIEVNDPLHYGGYHLYQQDYDHKAGQYTILGVHSDTGLYIVYAGFVLMTLGVFWVLWARRPERGPVAPEQAVYRVVGLGFPLLTLGLVLGAWWAKLAYSDYWGWDPKELWGLASWLVFLGYFHFRHTYGLSLTRANLGLAFVGLLAIVVTLIMVNKGLHSYSESGEKGLRLKTTLLGCLIMGALLAYVIAAVCLALKKRKIGMGFFAAGFLLALAAVITRWIEVEHLPLKEMFDVFLFLGMLAMPISLFCRFYLHVGGEALDALLGAVVLFPAAFAVSAESHPLMPALQTWLFAPHVTAYMVAYVILAKAGLLALWELVRKQVIALWRLISKSEAAKTPS